MAWTHLACPCLKSRDNSWLKRERKKIIDIYLSLSAVTNTWQLKGEVSSFLCSLFTADVQKHMRIYIRLLQKTIYYSSCCSKSQIDFYSQGFKYNGESHLAGNIFNTNVFSSGSSYLVHSAWKTGATYTRARHPACSFRRFITWFYSAVKWERVLESALSLSISLLPVYFLTGPPSVNA